MLDKTSPRKISVPEQGRKISVPEQGRKISGSEKQKPPEITGDFDQ